MSLSAALTAAMNQHGHTQKSLSGKIGTAQSNLSRVIAETKAPGEALLQALCSSKLWGDKETGLTVLRAWLEEQVVRAGRSPSEIGISIHGDNPEAREMEEDFRLIRDWLPGDTDVKGIIGFLADTARAERDAALKPQEEPMDSKVIPLNQPEGWHYLPCYGVAAGSPISGDEFGAEFKSDYSANHFAVKVFGDSMAPKIDDGEIVLIRKPESLNNPNVKKGEIYCFLVKGERTLKRYNTRLATQSEIDEGLSYTSPRGGAPRIKVLESINPAYPEILLSEGDEMLGWYDPANQPIEEQKNEEPESPYAGESKPYAPYIRPGESSEEFSERFRNENTPEEAAL
ncbi:MAG: S24 family peptidase, partial [Verrucomicrobiota bacterium]